MSDQRQQDDPAAAGLRFRAIVLHLVTWSCQQVAQFDNWKFGLDIVFHAPSRVLISLLNKSMEEKMMASLVQNIQDTFVLA